MIEAIKDKIVKETAIAMQDENDKDEIKDKIGDALQMIKTGVFKAEHHDCTSE